MIPTRFESSAEDIGGKCTAEMVQEHPLTSMLVVFGVGLGVGMVLSQTIGESAGGIFRRHESLGERLAAQIQKALKQALPEQVKQHFA